VGNVPGQYIVIQQAEWAGRKFYTAHDSRADQVVYLMQVPRDDRFTRPQHPNLPPLQPLVVENDAGWLVGMPPAGDTLEDLRSRGELSEQELVSMLLSVAGALTDLAALQPPLVPSYLDPACIKRDSLGRWVLDYLLLAQAPEVRKPEQPPPGIYPFGVLLYWLFTGQTARMTRVQVDRVEGVPSGLQFIMARCLGRRYPGLAELRADIERAGQEKDFRGLAQVIARQVSRSRPVEPAARPSPPRPSPAPARPAPAPNLGPKTERLFPDPWAAWEDGGRATATQPAEPAAKPRPQLEYRKVPLGGPDIPIDDRSWSLPTRPEEGFRKYVVPPPPDPHKQRLARWGALAAISLTTVLLGGWVALDARWIPEAVLPSFLRTPHPVREYPGLAVARRGEVGRELPPEPAVPGAPPAWDNEEQWLRAYKRMIRRGELPIEPATPEPTAPMPPPGSEPPQPVPLPSVPPKPGPAPAPRPDPPFFVQDASTGAMPIQIYRNGRAVGRGFLFPHPTTPYMSIQAFNYFFERSVYWVPVDGAAVRLFTGNTPILTRDYTLVHERLWLKLTPVLQRDLGVEVSAYSDGVMYFTTR
jgi:hypothetical protein